MSVKHDPPLSQLPAPWRCLACAHESTHASQARCEACGSPRPLDLAHGFPSAHAYSPEPTADRLKRIAAQAREACGCRACMQRDGIERATCLAPALLLSQELCAEIETLTIHLGSCVAGLEQTILAAVQSPIPIEIVSMPTREYVK